MTLSIITERYLRFHREQQGKLKFSRKKKAIKEEKRRKSAIKDQGEVGKWDKGGDISVGKLLQGSSGRWAYFVLWGPCNPLVGAITRGRNRARRKWFRGNKKTCIKRILVKGKGERGYKVWNFIDGIHIVAYLSSYFLLISSICVCQFIAEVKTLYNWIWSVVSPLYHHKSLQLLYLLTI